MQYNLSDVVEQNDAKLYFKKLIEQKKTIELKALRESRTAKQNSSLHKFYVIICEVLNEMGLDFEYTGLKGYKLSIRHTPTIVKDFIWRPIQMALFDIESTKDINTKQLNEIAEVIIKYFAEKGIHIDFPRKQN